MNCMHHAMTIITGPTAVGKTDFSLELAQQTPSAIINADVGQFYMPLSIGTAKPDWRSQPVAHYLFDLLSVPQDLNVVGYRALLMPLLNELQTQQKHAVLVGGSSFYIYSLFFPQSLVGVTKLSYEQDTHELWQKLAHIDPERAQAIAQNDRYRITRALDIWYGLGIKPSTIKPKFAPIAPAEVVILTLPTETLYARINARTDLMLKAGWLDETRALLPQWREFFMTKKLIGYDDIIRYLDGEIRTYKELVQTIQQKTRNYAKRQMTFNRMMAKKLEANGVRTIFLDARTPSCATLFNR